MPEPRTVPWWQAEPRRLARDIDEIRATFPSLEFSGDGQGAWTGELPRWPFDRPEPSGAPALLGGKGLSLRVEYVPAYPMVMPLLWPLDPEPELAERTQSTWHVLPIGGLCLLRSDAAWDPSTSIIELLLKAAGWRVEYALMKSGAIQSMSINGIVTDPHLDHLLQNLRLGSSAAPDAKADGVPGAHSGDQDPGAPTL